MSLTRRSFLFSAPAIVAVTSIMPVRVSRLPSALEFPWPDVNASMETWGRSHWQSGGWPVVRMTRDEITRMMVAEDQDGVPPGFTRYSGISRA